MSITFTPVMGRPRARNRSFNSLTVRDESASPELEDAVTRTLILKDDHPLLLPKFRPRCCGANDSASRAKIAESRNLMLMILRKVDFLFITWNF